MFQQIFWVFLVLGTVVGVVVISYMLYNAYRYRDTGERGDTAEEDRPELGELPTGGGKGRKLFLSFGLSAVVVISLVIWSYGTLLYVEQGDPVQDEEALNVEVVGYQFGWDFVYPNGNVSEGKLVVPANRSVKLEVTSDDTFHNFGIPDLRVKTDAIPGQTTNTWFIADQPGRYTAECFELCGAGHSFMTANVTVVDQQRYEQWYDNRTANTSAA